MNKAEMKDKIIEMFNSYSYDHGCGVCAGQEESIAKEDYSALADDIVGLHFSDVIPVDSDLSCDGCKCDGLQFGMRSPCETCKRFHSHHKDLYVKNQ